MRTFGLLGLSTLNVSWSDVGRFPSLRGESPASPPGLRLRTASVFFSSNPKRSASSLASGVGIRPAHWV